MEDSQAVELPGGQRGGEQDEAHSAAGLFDARSTEEGKVNDKTNSIVSLDQPYCKSLSIIFRSIYIRL